MILFHISTNINDIEHFYMLLAIHIYSLVKYLFKYFVNIFIEVLVFVLLNYK